MKSSLIAVLEKAVLKAARGLVRDFRELENLQVSVKNCGSFVTSADMRSNKVIIEILKEHYPKYSILSEESGEELGLDFNHRFVIDPLDGTNNFMNALPNFCISIGFEERGKGGKWEQLAGVIYSPILDELYWAEKGKGCFVEVQNQERKLFCSRKNLLKTCMVVGSIDNYADLDLVKNNFYNFRATGSSALDLAYVAAGKFDCFFHRKLKPWDISAGILMVREAKGIVSDFLGTENYFESGEVLASNLEISDIYKKLFITPKISK
jgi:myo-inositol-1(or 4)-monophosphatase